MVQEITPLGDQAALAYFDDESAASRFADKIRGTNGHWLVDVVQAYTSVAVFFDTNATTFAGVAEVLRSLHADAPGAATTTGSKLHRIPCCYEFQMDMDRIARKTGLEASDIIRLHTEAEYTIYAIGFCPGFPYLGHLPPALSGVPRLESPRVRVEPGSVGLTGRQTGIYPLARPGGWNLLGRTPLELVNVADGYFPLRTGDRIQFQRIDRHRYSDLLGARLANDNRSI